MISVFTRDGDEIRHFYTQCADFPDGTGRGIDLLSPVWHALDLLPQGRGDWLPDNDYFATSQFSPTPASATSGGSSV